MLEQTAQGLGRRDRAVERQAVVGIEVEDHLVGPLEGLDARAPHVELERAHLHERENALQRVDRRVGRRPVGLADRHRDHALRELLDAVLLKEALAAHALRAAHQRERPPRDVRQKQRGDLFVVAGDLELGQADVRIHHAIGMADGHAGYDGRRRTTCRQTWNPLRGPPPTFGRRFAPSGGAADRRPSAAAGDAASRRLAGPAGRRARRLRRSRRLCRGRRSPRCRRRLEDHLAGRLVEAQALERGVAQGVAAVPVEELDLGDQRRAAPSARRRPPCRAARSTQGGAATTSGSSRAAQVAHRPVVPAGADPTGAARPARRAPRESRRAGRRCGRTRRCAR